VGRAPRGCSTWNQVRLLRGPGRRLSYGPTMAAGRQEQGVCGCVGGCVCVWGGGGVA
jgi:hypothetical protein